MNCLEKTDLVKYLKGELDKEQCQRINDHITDCKKCTEQLSALTALMKLGHILDYEKKSGDAGSCIPKLQLLQYIVGLIDDTKITRHVFHCMDCKRNYFSYLQRYESVQACFEKLRELAAKLKGVRISILLPIEELLKIFFFPPQPAFAPAVRRINVMRGGTLPDLAVEEIEVSVIEPAEEITDKAAAEEIIKEMAEEGFTRAACYEQLGLYQEALNIYEELDPKNEDEIVLGRRIVLCRKLRKPEVEVMKLEGRYEEIMQIIPTIEKI